MEVKHFNQFAKKTLMLGFDKAFLLAVFLSAIFCYILSFILNLFFNINLINPFTLLIALFLCLIWAFKKFRKNPAWFSSFLTSLIFNIDEIEPSNQFFNNNNKRFY